MVVRHYGKKELIMASGAGVGMIQAYITRDMLDEMLQPIPVISDYIGAWGTWSVFGNIAAGCIAFGLTSFTNVVKNETLRNFLQGYGFTALLGGVFNGIFPNMMVQANLRARRFPRASTHNVITNPNYTNIYAPVARTMDTNYWRSYDQQHGGSKNMPNRAEAPLLT